MIVWPNDAGIAPETDSEKRSRPEIAEPRVSTDGGLAHCSPPAAERVGVRRTGGLDGGRALRPPGAYAAAWGRFLASQSRA